MKYRAVAIMLVISLLSGGLAHSLVSHEHGHSHSHTEDGSAIWSALHSSLRHEDKKTLFMLAEGMVFFVLTLALVHLASHTSTQKLSDRAKLRDPGARDALRRGVFRYRVFG